MLSLFVELYKDMLDKRINSEPQLRGQKVLSENENLIEDLAI